MNIRDELKNLGPLAHCGIALADYCESIADGGRFESADARWVIRPNNFITLEPHWKRTTNIAISIRGNPSEYAELAELRLKSGMAGYSECILTEAWQLCAAMFYARRANDIFRRGRNRTVRQLRLIET